MTRKRWNELDPTVRRAMVLVAVLDVALRVAALVDLARRPDAELRGARAAWTAAVAIVSSAGLVPTAYFLFGRRVTGQAGSTRGRRGEGPENPSARGQ